MKNMKRFNEDLEYRKWKIHYVARKERWVLEGEAENEIHFKRYGLRTTVDGKAEIKINPVTMDVKVILHHPLAGMNESVKKNCSGRLIQRLLIYPRTHTRVLNGVRVAANEPQYNKKGCA